MCVLPFVHVEASSASHCLSVVIGCLLCCISLQHLCSLYQDLSTSAAGAADWLMNVGVTWASTCHVDLPQVSEQDVGWGPHISSPEFQHFLKFILLQCQLQDQGANLVCEQGTMQLTNMCLGCTEALRLWHLLAP